MQTKTQRNKELEALAGEAFKMMFFHNTRETLRLFEENKDEIVDSFCAALSQGAECVVKLQHQGVKGPVVFVMASFLLSDILVGRKALRFDFYDAKHYADVVDAHSYWDYSRLFPYVHDNEKQIRTLLKENMPRFVEYEVRDVMTLHQIGIFRILEDVLKVIVQSPKVRESVAEIVGPEWVLAYGEYFGSSEKLLFTKEDT